MPMVEVTRARFFEELGKQEKAGCDIMPAITKEPYPYHSTWSDKRTRAVFGRIEEKFGQTEDGRVHRGVVVKRYLLNEDGRKEP